MAKIKWQLEKVVIVEGLEGERRLRAYARTSRAEIIVRVENDGDTSKYAEWGMPKILGITEAVGLAVAQTRPEDIKE